MLVSLSVGAMASSYKGTNCDRFDQLLVLVLLGTCFLPSHCGYVCPGGWTWVTGTDKCLKMYQTLMEWTTARTYCQVRNGDLLTIRDASTSNFVTDFAKQKNVNEFWIGANDIANEGTFVWLDEKTPLDFDNWELFEPNNMLGDQNCAYLRDTHNYRWDDQRCTRRKYFVCERQAERTPEPTTTTTTAPALSTSEKTLRSGKTTTSRSRLSSCPCQWIKIPGLEICFRVFHERMSWNEAMGFCQGHGADLIPIRDYQTEFFVAYYVKNEIKEDTWIGGNGSSEDEKCPFVKALDDKCTCPDNPCQRQKKFVCQLLESPSKTSSPMMMSEGPRRTIKSGKTATSGTATLNDILGNSASVEYGCPNDWIGIPDSRICVKFFDERKTWKAARQMCKRHGGDLISIRDAETNDALLEIVESTSQDAFWIGLHDVTGEGRFVWLDETTPIDFDFWESGERADFKSLDKCVYLEVDNEVIWKYSPCDSLFAFWCERPTEVSDDLFGTQV